MRRFAVIAPCLLLPLYSTLAVSAENKDEEQPQPVELQQLLQALSPSNQTEIYSLEQPVSPDTLEWELIQRTLQRKLQKRPTNRLS